jgi:putative membrane protein
MALRWLLSALHLLALGIGLGAIYARARGLRGVLDAPGLRRVFLADTWWGVAAGLWIVTGLLRAFGGYEKGSDYYLHNHLFLTKMGLLVLILVLEIGPMVRLVVWRRSLAQGTIPDTGRAARYARGSMVQAVLVILMLLMATGMARGFGAMTP